MNKIMKIGNYWQVILHIANTKQMAFFTRKENAELCLNHAARYTFVNESDDDFCNDWYTVAETI